MIVGDIVALPPALNRCGVSVTQPARGRSDSTLSGNDRLIVHTHQIRSTRTHVNVESVRAGSDDGPMDEPKTTGERLRALRARTGMSLAALAKESGYTSASGIQRYFEAGFAKPLAIDVARKLIVGFVGKGVPPITSEEVIALTGLETNARVVRMEGASEDRMRDDLPIYGSALGAARRVDDEAIEQTTLNRAEVIQYAKRPVLLNGNARAYGLYVSGSSMEPRFGDGELIVVDPKGRLRVGDDVVIYLRPTNPEDDNGEAARGVLVKRLRRRTASHVELEQFSPPIVFQISADEIVDTHRVIPLSEMLA